MPFWLALGLGLLGAYQTYKAAQAQQQAIQSLQQGGLSPEEVARMRQQGTANLRLNLARRGLLDSGLLPGGVAALEGELALAQAAAKRASPVSDLPGPSPTAVVSVDARALGAAVRAAGAEGAVVGEAHDHQPLRRSPRWPPSSTL